MKIYPVLIAMVKGVHALSRKVQRHDPDLARQMRRASSSVALNAIEGWYGHRGNSIARFGTALSEAKETTGTLDLSVACGYLHEAAVATELDHLNHIAAVMWKLSRPRR